MKKFTLSLVIEGTQTMLKKLTRLAVILGGLSVLPGCASGPAGPEYRIWQEEVKLNDGRVIVVTQKKRCEGAYTGGNYAACIAREAWLTINLPEFSAQPIVWHENLFPIILNVHNGHLYVVGCPPTGREFRFYNKPRPPYIGFMFENGQWKRIPFEAIPASIYDSNMLLDAFPTDDIKLLTIAKKTSREVNGRPTIGIEFKRINPGWMSNFN